MNFSVCQLAVESLYALPHYHGFFNELQQQKEDSISSLLYLRILSHERPGKFDVSVPCLFILERILIALHA